MPAPAAATAAAGTATTPAGGIIEARRSKEAAYYGVDAMELTDRGASRGVGVDWVGLGWALGCVFVCVAAPASPRCVRLGLGAPFPPDRQHTDSKHCTYPHTPPHRSTPPHTKPKPTATQIISDYVEGALADVRAQFVEALRRRGGGSGAGAAGADAFYEENVAPVRVVLCVVRLLGSGVAGRGWVTSTDGSIG